LQIKTTQPRRYLVRPNQGIIAPNQTDKVSILLVEKDKQILLQSFERLGQTGLDHSKDKFLVQSCVVSSAFSSKLSGDVTELYDALTSMWNSVSSGGSQTSVSNKKLHVKHTVQEGGAAAPADKSKNGAKNVAKSFKRETSAQSNVETMTSDQLKSELTNLRRKYDELVSFSVNLTAERDILGNSLEQTKRDFNREQATRTALEGKQGGGTAASSGGPSMLSTLVLLLFVAVACLLVGVRLGTDGNASFLETVPVLDWFYVTGTDAADAGFGSGEL